MDVDIDKTILPDFNNLTSEDLQDEYKKLFAKYENLKKIHDSDLQEIYILQRNVNTAKATEAHLTQELEMVSNSQDLDIDKIKKKFNLELEDLRRKYSEIEEDNGFLEKNLSSLRSENENLQEKVHELESVIKKNSIESKSLENINKELDLEQNNLELLAKVDQVQGEYQKMLMTIADRERQIEVFQEEVQCLQENISSKREELEEKTTLLETTQERMIEMNSELAMLKSTPESEKRKGNSLFAEVDDQRQAMKSQLLAQKNHYLQMKKVYQESEFEIRRLKRENAAMHSEIQTCSSIFLNSKKHYEEKLNERICQLLKQNDDLERKLSLTQDRLISQAEENGISWLDSMLKFCNNETKELKIQLHNLRLQKAVIEKNYRNSQEELAKWRFEALKSRCIIIDRETLLEENLIKFESFTQNNFKIDANEMENASPSISFGRRRSTLSQSGTSFNNSNNTSKSHDESIKCFNNSKENAGNNFKNSTVPTTDTTPLIKNAKIASKCCKTVITKTQLNHIESKQPETMSTTLKTSDEINLKMGQSNNIENMTENHNSFSFDISKTDTEKEKEFSNSLGTSAAPFEIYEDTTQNILRIEDSSSVCNARKDAKDKESFNCSLDNKTKTPPKINLPKKQSSILVQHRDVFEVENNSKYVKFAEGTGKFNKEDKASHQVITKKTKSNLIVRKIVIKSKEEKIKEKK